MVEDYIYNLACNTITDVGKQIILQKQLAEEWKKVNHKKYVQFFKFLMD
jgi:hypothetical protein